MRRSPIKRLVHIFEQDLQWATGGATENSEESHRLDDTSASLLLVDPAQTHCATHLRTRRERCIPDASRDTLRRLVNPGSAG